MEAIQLGQASAKKVKRRKPNLEFSTATLPSFGGLAYRGTSEESARRETDALFLRICLIRSLSRRCQNQRDFLSFPNRLFSHFLNNSAFSTVKLLGASRICSEADGVVMSLFV